MGLAAGRIHKIVPNDLLWPDAISVFPTEVQLGRDWIRLFTAVGFPRRVRPGWLLPLLEFPWPITLAFYTGPIENRAMLGDMNRRLTWQKGSQVADRILGRLSNPDQETAMEDAERIRLELARGDAKMLDVSLCVGVWARSPDELNEATVLLQGLAEGMMLMLRLMRFRQAEGLKRVLATGAVADTREMDSQAWATLFPLTGQDLMHPQGQVWGTNATNRSLVILDRYRYPSPHSITIGWSGAGKSFGAKLEALRARYRGLAVAVVDPEGEYRVLASVGAEVIALGSASPGMRFDPFAVDDLEDADLERWADFVERLLARLSDDWDRTSRAALLRAIWRHQSETETTRGRFVPPPQVDGFDRILEILREESPDCHRTVEMARDQWRRLSGWGTRRPGEAGELGDFVVFDLNRVSARFKGACYLVLAEMLSRETRRNRRRLVIIDEAWHLLHDPEMTPYLEELFRRARKWGVALSLLTQDFHDLMRNPSAAVCLKNAPIVLLLHQHPESLNELSRELHLHPGELDRVMNAPVGEGLLIAGDDRLALRLWASPVEKAVLEPQSHER